MKFLHLGDLHIGRSLGDFDLIEDQRYILKQITDIALERSADAVIIAGDVYDRPVPSEAAVRLLDSFIRRLSENNIKLYIISGNHDSDERLSFGSGLFESGGVYIRSRFDGTAGRYILRDELGDVNIYLLPFIKASQVRHFYPEEKIETYEDAVSIVLKHSVHDTDERNVLVAHQFVAGKEEVRFAGSEGAAVKQVGNVEKISSSCLKDFDYVALGHIHSPQSVGYEHIRYSGSPLKYSLSEANNDKSVPLVTIGEKGQVGIELIPLRPMRDLRHLKGEMKKLLDRDNIVSQENFIYVTLTDENTVENAMNIFRQVYPNTVRIDYDNSHTKEIEQVDIAGVSENRSFDELISDFYKQIYSCDINEEELRVMLSVAMEAGVIDETG